MVATDLQTALEGYVDDELLLALQVSSVSFSLASLGCTSHDVIVPSLRRSRQSNLV